MEEKNLAKKNSFIKKKVGIIAIGIVIIGGISYLLFRKDIMYNYYVMKGNRADIESNQLEDYNKALGFKYTKDVVNDIYDSLEGNDNVEKVISDVSNLKVSDKNNIIMNVYKEKAEDAFDMNNYSQCAYYLRQAEKNGYNIKAFKNYDKLKEALEESGRDTLASEFRSGNSSDTYFKNDSKYNNLIGYIIPDSYSRNLNKNELEKYDDYTLGLIKAEILARHGFVFKENKYKNYFSGKYWYVKDPTFKGTNSEMNNYEVNNIKLVEEVQREKNSNK